jgi:hypothetical protein
VKTTVTYRDAAEAIWGEAGTFAHDSYDELRELLYPELPDQVPIAIGITAYGHCVGLTHANWEYGPRISLFSSAFRRGGRYVFDIVAHEMLHAWLWVSGVDTGHDSYSWYEAVGRLSPVLIGQDVNAKRGADRKSVRVPNPGYVPGNGKPKTLVRKVRNPDAIQHADMAAWPHSFRPVGYYQGDDPIRCPSY